jgi:hypothetical protein
VRAFQVYILVRIPRIKKDVMQISEIRGPLGVQDVCSAMACVEHWKGDRNDDSREWLESNSKPPSSILCAIRLSLAKPT